MIQKKQLLSYTEKKRLRVDFGEHDEVLKIPHLYDIQIKSYKKFIKENTNNNKIDNEPELTKIFKSIFPIYSNNKNMKLEYIQYKLGESLFTANECKIKGLTYSSPLKIKVHLCTNYQTKNNLNPIKSIIQDVYVLNMPLMTNKGTFVINGTERVIVSQLHKSPGLFFETDKTKTNTSSNTLSYLAKIIPHRGAWLDIEFDSKDCLYARIDKKKKFPITMMLKSLGVNKEEILDIFLKKNKIHIKSITNDNIIDCLTTNDIKNKNDEIIIPSNTKITTEIITLLTKENIKNITIIQTNNKDYRSYISNTLNLDTTATKIEAIIEIYKILRPGEPPTQESAKQLFDQLFFSNEKYDLSPVGRMKINERLKINETTQTTLSKNDVIYTIKKLIEIKNEKDHTDDIDHLGNRRVRSVGEIIENQFKSGFLKIERSIKEKLSLSEYENLGPQDIINTKPIATIIREFFCSSQLSQFMDQTNPLAEITHKRRLSALGPGGLTRERAGFEVRDVHNTHYGRICPIETPEGPNIGLINSLAIYAKPNIFGFLETPYIKIENKKITNHIEYLTASKESHFIIAQANAKINKNTNEIIDEQVSCRFKNEFITTTPDKVQYMDISPKQIVSVATALIPFLEHDDANRALMGSNMQRQAVPILRVEKPLIGTGMEKIVAMDSGTTILAKRNGVVEKVDSSRIIIKVNNSEKKDEDIGVDIYNLIKYSRSNQNTCVNQKPLVKIGDKVKKHDIIADGSATDLGELALGQNLFTAFMTWNGYNFEDSVILSENVIKENKLSSIHIEEQICIARDSKLGPEEITSDIPNISDNALKNLDESGIIYIGANVKPGDILVGKITKKTESQLSPEEKLLQAIFGEKASDVKDSSLRVPSGIKGTIIDVQIFTRNGTKKDNRTTSIEEDKLNSIKKDLTDELNIIKNNIIYEIKELIEQYNKDDEKININLEQIIKLNTKKYQNIKIENDEIKNKIQEKKLQIELLYNEYAKKLNDAEEKIKRCDNLPPGITKIVKISIAIKRQIQIGDKISGRHGNKGVISTIIPVEDMPYLENGTPLEIILNPLGVPSRMNIGQVLETHLGWASKELGKKLKRIYNTSKKEEMEKFIQTIYNAKKQNLNLETFSNLELNTLINNLANGVPIATPIFDGIKENEIKNLLKLADLPESGKTTLYDGKTGLPFDNKITVGYQYIMKLNHLIDDKIHARSTGSYSLVSQQPLGGKAQFGGQRFGEMEVWALEAYGAAYTLQEMLTIKSDDISGRTKIYKNIIDNNHQIEIGIPEAFNVLLKEILSLGLNIELEYE